MNYYKRVGVVVSRGRKKERGELRCPENAPHPAFGHPLPQWGRGQGGRYFALHTHLMPFQAKPSPARFSSSLKFLQAFLNFRARQVGIVERRIALRQETTVKRASEFHEALVIWFGVKHGE